MDLKSRRKTILNGLKKVGLEYDTVGRISFQGITEPFSSLPQLLDLATNPECRVIFDCPGLRLFALALSECEIDREILSPAFRNLLEKELDAINAYPAKWTTFPISFQSHRKPS